MHSRVALMTILFALAMAAGYGRWIASKYLADACEFPTTEQCRASTIENATVPRRLLCGRGVQLNTDDIEELRFLPGIGPVRARNIVEYRRQNGFFSSPEDLLAVDGIGPKTLQKATPWLDPILQGTEIVDKK